MRRGLDILYQDRQFIAVAKPAGLAAIPGRGEPASLLQQLAAQLGLPYRGQADPRLRLVHRLDKDTSGVMLFALTREAQRFVSHQFQNNTVVKEYLALVAGRPADDQGTIDAPLAPHPARPQRMIISRHGRPARTDWRVEARYGRITLLRVLPRTGKTHQIRVHLRWIGLPLLVDPLYNPGGCATGLLLSSFKRGYRPKRDEPERPLIGRLTLHAEKLRFVHPGGQSIEIACPLPRDFRAAVAALAKYAR